MEEQEPSGSRLSETLPEARADVERLTVEHETAVREVDRVVEALTAARSRRDLLTVDADQARTVLSAHDEQVAALTKRVSELTSRQQAHHRDVEQLASAIADGEVRLGELDTHLTHATRTAETAGEALTEVVAESERLSVSSANAKEAAAEAEAAVAEAEEQLALLVADREAASVLVAGLEVELSALESGIDGLNAVAKSSVAAADKIAEMVRSAEHEVEVLEQGRQGAVDRASVITEQAAAWTERLDDVGHALSEARARVTETSAGVESATQRRDSAMNLLEQRRAEVASAEQREQDHAARLDQAETAEQQARARLDAVTKAIDQSHEAMTRMRKSYETAATGVAECARNIEDSQSRIAEAERTRAQAEMALSELDAAFTTVAAEISGLEREEFAARFNAEAAERRLAQGKLAFTAQFGDQVSEKSGTRRGWLRKRKPR